MKLLRQLPSCKRRGADRKLPRVLASALVALAVAGLLLPAHAVDVSPHSFVTTTAVDDYRNLTQQELASCGASIQAALKQTLWLDRSEPGCIAIGQRVCRTDFEEALQVLRKPDAREALRAYHHAFMTALDGIAPREGEPAPACYERRQRELKHLMAHAWTRFELAE